MKSNQNFYLETIFSFGRYVCSCSGETEAEAYRAIGEIEKCALTALGLWPSMDIINNMLA